MPEPDPPGNLPRRPGSFGSVGYFVVCVILFAITVAVFVYLDASSSANNLSPFQGLGMFLVLIPASMSFAAFIFGVMDSYSTYTGTVLSGQLRLGGPIVGAALVFVGGYYFVPQGQEKPASAPKYAEVRFSMKFWNSGASSAWSKDKATYVQEKPSRHTYDMIPQEYHADYGEYLRDRIDLPSEGQTYRAIIQRKPEQSTWIEDQNSIPHATICFTVTGAPTNEPLRFRCYEDKPAVLEYPVDWLTLCPAEDIQHASLAGAFVAMLQEQRMEGWVVPSLETLMRNNAELGTTYTSFSIRGSLAGEPASATAYTYQVYVNGTPVFLDGLRKEQTRTAIDKSKTFALTFGLENLDFSGARLGKEEILVALDFYGPKGYMTTVPLRRDYVALRDVEPIEGETKGVRFSWTGSYVIGHAQDGYQIFLWSTTERERVQERKRRFDAQELRYGEQDAVAVIRPPYGGNRYYGLLIGLRGKDRRVRFTFSRDDADELVRWLRSPSAAGAHAVVGRNPWIRRLTG